MAAIAADLDADAPRLVLADALQAIGDPRGELIAIEVELARLGCDRTRLALWDLVVYGRSITQHARRDWIGDGLASDDHARIRDLRIRERELLATEGEHWEPGLWPGCRWGRGFVDHAYAGELSIAGVFERLPLIRSLEVVPVEEAQLDEPKLAQLQQLRVSVIANPVIRTLIERASTWPHLRELSVSSTSSQHAYAIEALLDSALLPRLEALDLYGDDLAPPRVEALLARTSLQHLQLGDNNHGPEILETIAAHAGARSLEILDCLMLDGDAGYAALARSRLPLQALRILEQRTTWLAPGVLADLSTLPALRVLDLGGNPIGDRFDELIDGRFPSLIQLGLRQCELVDAHVLALAGSPLFDRLRVLDLSSSMITSAGAVALERAPGGARLSMLDLRQTQISGDQLARLRARFPQADVRGGA